MIQPTNLQPKTTVPCGNALDANQAPAGKARIHLSVLLIALAFLGISALPARADYHEALKKRDYAAALTEILPLAQRGDAEAQCYYGEMLLDGLGVAKDETQALNWILRAAYKKNARACFDAGYMYDEGKGTKAIPTSAIYWYTKAAELGDVDAELNIALIYLNGGEHFRPNPTLACQWLQKASDHDNVKAQYLLGRCYAEGTGVERDVEKGLELVARAGGRGLSEAVNYLINFKYDEDDSQE